MAEEAAATSVPTATETPPTPVEGQAAPAPANDGGKADPKAPANDNAKAAEVTEADFIALVEKFGEDKALELVAKRKNYVLDGTTVTVKERADLREEKRKQKAQIEEWKRQVSEEIETRVKESSGDIEFGRAVRAAYQAGDYDGVARALGKQGWNDIQEDFIARLADPNHKRLTELERKLQEKEQLEAQQRAQAEAQQKQAQQAQAEANYRQQLSTEMKASGNQILSALGDFPDVVNMIFAVQRHAYQNEGIALTPEQAMQRPLPGGRTAVRLILEQWHAGLSKAFQAAEAAKPAPGAPKPKGKTDAKPPVAPSRGRNLDDDEWLRSGAERLAEAMRQDAQRDAERLRKGNSQAG